MDLKNQLTSKIHKEFPRLKFKTARLVTKGWDHDVLVLDDNFIVRFAKARLYKSSFTREVKFLREFSKISNLKVPNYTFLSKDKSFGGYEMIKGKELTPQIYNRLSPSQKRKIVRDLAKFVSILHNIPVKKAKQFGFQENEYWTQTLNGKQKWFQKEFVPKVGPKLTLKQNDFIKKFIESFYKSQYSIKPRLGHYDLSHDHIIIKAGAIAGIIDFGDVNIGDPAHEFNGFFDYDKKMPGQIYKLYTGSKDKSFFKRSYEHFVHRWIYLLYDGLVRRKNKALWKEARIQINKIISDAQG
ncbi:MAG: aminoglycoside phosphotransferase family protein [Candidatus Doudnabacteria bacterium]|nr:aminoglycoside phosphotransferase family protein [Candidatus Doudnabacteria bacterium]